jgi:hypothetical protein
MNTRDRILEINLELKNLRDEKESLLVELQSTCSHEYVVETPFQPSTFFNPMSPARICLVCLTEEHDWYFKTLKNKPVEVVDRDKFYRYRDLKTITFKKVPILS